MISTNITSFYNKLVSLSKKYIIPTLGKVSTESHQLFSVISSFFHSKYRSNIPEVEETKREHIIIPFSGKFIDRLCMNSVLRDTKHISLLPELIKTKLPLMIFYKYNEPIGRKLQNHGKFLQKLTMDQMKDIISSDCHCSRSPYNYLPHNHIITGDLNIIDNSELRKIMSFGSKFRESLSVDSNSIRESLHSCIDNFMNSKAGKYHLDIKQFDAWGIKTKQIIDNRINFFIQHKPHLFHPTSSLFEDHNVINCLKELHEKFIISTADKASNNFVFVCKKFYTQVLIDELGIDLGTLSCTGNNTYSYVSNDKEKIINETVVSLKNKFNIICEEDNKHIPKIFWNPKLHKNPYKPRFIAGARRSVTKQIESMMNKGLHAIKAYFKNYCKTIASRTGINFYWSIDSSLQFLDKIKSLDIWSMQVHDFSTLYTNLGLEDVEETLHELCDLLFSSHHKYICINQYRAFFSKKKHKDCSCFDKSLFKKAISFILNNTFVSFAGFILKQVRGVPMGGGSSSPIADLYLSMKEFKYMMKLLKSKKFNLARLLSNTSRYIDDINNINYKSFLRLAKDIYPAELLLSRCGNNDKEVAYLDIKINIYDNGIMTSIYNKTDDFNFPVVNFIFPESNVPKELGYQVFYGQVLRYSKIISTKDDFISKCVHLYHVFYGRGYAASYLKRSFKRIFKKNISALYKFGFRNEEEALIDLIRMS